MEEVKNATDEGDRDDPWRNDPKERLFAPPERGDGKQPPSVIVSDVMMRCLAEGRVPGSERQIAFANILADAVLGDDENPLSDFAELYRALDADYSYSDAEYHLEGYSEGMLYGMLRLAECMVEKLDDRGDSFLPGAVLLHPDVLLASCLSHTMDASRISELLGVPVRDVLIASADLRRERIVVHEICGKSRFFFPSRRGEGFAMCLREMADSATGATDGDPAEVSDAMMLMADFADRDAVERAVRLLIREGGVDDPTGAAADMGDAPIAPAEPVEDAAAEGTPVEPVADEACETGAPPVEEPGN